MVGIITLIVLAVIFTVAIFRPAWTVAVVLTMFPIEQALQASSGIFRDRGSLANMAVGITVILSLLFSLVRGRLVLRSIVSPPMILTTTLYCWAGLSYFWTFSPEWLAEYMRWTAPYIVVIIGGAPLLISGFRDLRELRIALLIVGTIVAVLILTNPNFQYVYGRLMVNVDSDSRTNPLAIGALGGLLVLLALLGPAKESRTAILVLRMAAFVIGLALGFGSGSRGEVIAAVVAGFIFLPMSRRVANPVQFITTVAIGAAFLGGVFLVRSYVVSPDNEERWSLDSLAYGSGGRLDNVIDIAGFYLQRPMNWFQGLGSVAFHDLPSRTGDPYTHVLLADIVFELGVPGITLFGAIVYVAVLNSRRLFKAVRDNNEARALVTLLSAFSLYEFIIANKAGLIWAQYDLFFGLCVLGRLTQLEADPEMAALPADDEGADDFESADGEPFIDEPQPGDDSTGPSATATATATAPLH